MSGMTVAEIAELWAQKQPPQADGTALSELRQRVLDAAYEPPRLNRHERRRAKSVSS